MRFLIVSALLLSAAPALAQQELPATSHDVPIVLQNRVPPFDPRKGYEDAAHQSRDGCVNVPAVAHNSADCSIVPKDDTNSLRNIPATDLSGRPTGATENAERTRRILSGEASD